MKLLWGCASALCLALLLSVPATAERGDGTSRFKRQQGTSVIDVFRGTELPPRRESSQPRKPASPDAVPAEAKAEPPYAYQPETLVTLRAGSFSDAAPSDPLASAIFTELLNTESQVRVATREKPIVIDFYRANGFKPLWTTAAGLTPRAENMLAFFAASDEDAMDPADYLPAALNSFTADPAAHAGDLAELARLDLGLTAMALKYARQASSGRLIPNRLSGYYDVQPVAVDPLKVMKVVAWSPFPIEYLKSLQPQHPAYGQFKAALAAKRESVKNDGEPIAAGGRLKPGQDDDRVAALRHRLGRLGYAVSPLEAERPQNYDATLVASVRAFQKDTKLKVTGNVDAPTTLALNSRSERRDLDRLVYAMERMRWLPHDLGERYVFVNQAAYELRFIDRGQELWKTKVIVGKPDNQTVVFHDRMETVVFNPSWGVPQSIIRNEMLPILMRDPGYLDRLGYRVIDRKGKIIHSSAIDWSNYSSASPLGVQQPPGDDNALGEIKFLFPNSHDIYMHDTPTRALFDRNVRALSHGCVRVQDPRRFAELVLGVGPDEVAEKIDSGESRSVKVKRPLSVHLAYFTAWPEADGRIAYFPDIYGRDRRMEQAFGTIALASR
ncbi:murein L,D-transpeptidase [soil metagenome]